MPHLVRRADPFFLPPPCLPSSFLPFLLRPVCLASPFLSCPTSSALPCFHPPSLPPDRPCSMMSPLRPGGSGRVAKHAARASFWFDSRRRCPLVYYTVCLNHCLEKAQMKNLRRNCFTRFKHHTVETMQMFYKIVCGRHRSLPTIAKFQLVLATTAIFVFQLPTTKAHKWFPWGVNKCLWFHPVRKCK